MSIRKLPSEWHQLLHRLWSLATQNPGYVKADWMKLEEILHQGAEAMAELQAKHGSRRPEPEQD